jgi:5-hydroxyisourate hydrolase
VSLSTHVLDAVTGAPARGLAVRLEGPVEQDGTVGRRAERTTDLDGRIADLGLPQMTAGTYRLIFSTGDWFAAQGRATFYPEIVVSFTYQGSGHVHVPVLLSPFSYTTYRGS